MTAGDHEGGGPRMKSEKDRFLQGLADKVGRRMQARGMSAADLAEATAICRERIERIARAEVEAGAIELMRLAACLGGEPDDLLGRLAGGPPEDILTPLLDAGYIGFDPRLRIWGLTERGEARLREFELREEEGTDPPTGPDGPGRGAMETTTEGVMSDE
ncbi:MAG: helix-turn-helix transcriptional regulator [Actinobacteria bacterium]|nr:helix-turn-helix transcriptional regulator [Actinomycetota bacterium]